jgi:hypothetical protein
MKVTPEQMEAVLRLDGPNRYSFFIKGVASFQEAWGLYDNGWAMLGDDDGKQVFPLWPAKEYAAACKTGSWANFEPRLISLQDLIEDVLPTLEKEGVLPGVFPTPERKTVTPEITQLLADLHTEKSRYE